MGGRIKGSVVVHSSHPRFEELKASMPRSYGKTAISLPPTHPLYAEIVPTLDGHRRNPSAEPKSSASLYDEGLSHGVRGGIVREAFALREEMGECQKDIDDLSAHLKTAIEKRTEVSTKLASHMLNEVPKALKDGTIFTFDGAKWLYLNGAIAPMSEVEIAFAAAPKARKKKGMT